MLEGATHDGISVLNMLYALLLIRGARLVDREEAWELGEHREPAVLRFVKIDPNGNFSVALGGSQKIFLHFKSLWVNRVQFEGTLKTPVRQVTLQPTERKVDSAKKRV